jgi:hypothetical protein
MRKPYGQRHQLRPPPPSPALAPYLSTLNGGRQLGRVVDAIREQADADDRHDTSG